MLPGEPAANRVRAPQPRHRIADVDATGDEHLTHGPSERQPGAVDDDPRVIQTETARTVGRGSGILGRARREVRDAKLVDDVRAPDAGERSQTLMDPSVRAGPR